MKAAAAALALLLAACGQLSAQQIAQLSAWSASAANHCAARGQCPAEAACVNATVAALDLTASYDSASTACMEYR